MFDRTDSVAAPAAHEASGSASRQQPSTSALRRSRRAQRRVVRGRSAAGYVIVAAVIASGCAANPSLVTAASSTVGSSVDVSAHATTVAVASPPSTATASPTSTPASLPATLPQAALAPTQVNVYEFAGTGALSPAVAGTRQLVYVPSPAAKGPGTVDVIDQTTIKVIDRFVAGPVAQHVVPSWDLKTLYVNASAANQLVPIDPTTGKPGRPIPIERPYNLYFTHDGSRAVVQNEQHDRLDYYDPHTWQKLKSVPSTCKGNNHADWSADGAYFLVTCEFSGELLKVDTATGDIIAKISLAAGAMPQDVRLVPDGSKFYVADMMHDRVWIIDGNQLVVTGSIRTGVGAHGIYPSRDGTRLYVANRGRHRNDERRRSRPGDGSVSVLDPATDTVTATWTIPGGGSPDMGGVSADGSRLWLSGRYDSEVYVFDTTTGQLAGRIKTSAEPHGLLVWPQPGRYSLGHTGNTR